MKEDDFIELTYEVICRTPVCMLEHAKGDTYEDKVNQMIHDCEEAMEGEMRHWGDFDYFIDCVKDKLIDYSEDDKCGVVKIENDYRANSILSQPGIQKLLEEYIHKIVNITEDLQENTKSLEALDIRPILEEFVQKITKTI